MHKRLRERLDSWDLKSVFLTILFFSIGIFLFLYFTGIRDRFRAEDKENFKGKATGEILSVEKAERISQSRWTGTKIYVDSYRVEYQYNHQGRTFRNVDIIPVTATNQKLLSGILNRGTNNTCVVRFDEGEPSRSILVEGD